MQVTLDTEILDRVDELVAPGVTLNADDNSYGAAELTPPGPPTIGPVLVLAGEADFTSVARLDEALTGQISGPAVQLTIDATNLRYADLASIRTLVEAAMKVGTRNGSVTLLNPQPSVARMLDLLCADEMFSIRCRTAGEAQPDGG